MEIKAYLDNTQETMGQQMEVLLRMDSFFDFFYIFFLLAVLPAICEETLFRGVVQPLFIKGFKNVHLGILVTSLIFGVMHQQFYSFMSITALSIVLGYLKEWSKSLWIPIIMHLINNGTIVISIYYFNVSLEEANDLSGGWDQGYFVVGIVLFASVLYLLRRIIQKNGTHFYS
jgi:membrane protease YdiL (CAAX protease family)